jgi:anti-anti-sigma factor
MARPFPPRHPAGEPGAAHLDLTGDLPVVVVDVTAWLDLATVPAVLAVVDAAIALAPPRLAVDLSQCELADAYGLGMLERASRRAALQGTELVLLGVDRRLARVLRFTGLDAVLPVVDDARACA